ncbi:hypothetical protein GGR92_005404 [Spirosoma lacussanchae]
MNRLLGNLGINPDEFVRQYDQYRAGQVITLTYSEDSPGSPNSSSGSPS